MDGREAASEKLTNNSLGAPRKPSSGAAPADLSNSRVLTSQSSSESSVRGQNGEWSDTNGGAIRPGLSGPLQRSFVGETIGVSGLQRGRPKLSGTSEAFETDSENGANPRPWEAPSDRLAGNSKDRPALLMSNPLRRVQLCSQALMAVICLLALIPFVYKVPVARKGYLFQMGTRRSLSEGDVLYADTQRPNLDKPAEYGAGVIDSEKILALVTASDERAKAGLVQQVEGGKTEPEGGLLIFPEKALEADQRIADNVTLANGTSSLWNGIFAGAGREAFECDRSSPLTDVCTIQGDVRINVVTGEVVLYAKNSQTPRGQRHIRPHPRKWNWGLMEGSVTQFTVQSVDYNDPNAPQLECTKRNTAPGVVFSVGGFCGGVFHDFNEVYLPLFETTHSYKGDVIMLVADLKGDWWWHDAPRRSFVGAMTKHAIRLIGRGIDTESYAQGVECFDHLTLGLYQNLCMYDEFGGKESRAFAKSKVKDFAPYIRKGMDISDPPEQRVFVPAGATPVVGIVQRLSTRKLINYQELVRVAEREGFKVVPITYEHLSPEQAAETMAPLDILVGVHGAGLSNICLMRPGGAVLQIMPYGEGGPRNVIGLEYKNFATAMEADYLEWSVPVHDSTIKDQYNHTDWIVTSPLMIWKYRGQDAMNIYHSQDVIMPEDMFAAYLRQMRRTLNLKARLVQELEARSRS